MLEPLLERARADENVLGVVVHGSRGRGLHIHEASDGDVIVVVHEPRAQQALFRESEMLAREHGHGATIDGWEPDVAWLRG